MHAWKSCLWIFIVFSRLMLTLTWSTPYKTIILVDRTELWCVCFFIIIKSIYDSLLSPILNGFTLHFFSYPLIYICVFSLVLFSLAPCLNCKVKGTVVHLTGDYVNPIQNDSLSKLGSWFTLTGCHFVVECLRLLFLGTIIYLTNTVFNYV